MGQFDDTHTATLDFNLHRNPDDAQFRATGIIDTGFTGFVQVPAFVGDQLGLLSGPRRVATTTLANGALQEVILKPVRVTVNKVTGDGYCMISPTDDSLILIGMDFLRRFQRMLIVSYKMGIHFVPEQNP